VLLTGEHVLVGFDCGKPALDDWLARRALGNQAMGTSRTWVVTERGSPQVVAFYASCTSSVLRRTAPEPMAKSQPDEIPAILLGRMAVDSKYKGQGLGAALLKHFMLKAIEVANSVGVRIVLVHAKDDDARAFYQRYDFSESPMDPLTLMMLLPIKSV
jgi:GNAT superfamily N-acetyltransferase